MRIFSALLFIALFLVAHAEQLKFDVAAASAILINSETGKILFEKNAHQRLFPASTTKIATALYILEKTQGQLDHMLTVLADPMGVVPAIQRQAPNSKYPSYRLEPEGTIMGLTIGEILPLKTLLYGMMLRSGNDAANVIAQQLCGSIPRFVEEMNQFLSTFGLEDTHFSNPHGLFYEDHYTTARDLAFITAVALKNPIFRDIVKAQSYPRQKTNKREESVLIQNNKFVKPGKYYYPKAIGVKTGYTFRSGHTFVAAAEHEGRTLIAVFLKTPKPYNYFEDAIKLFEAAFSQVPVKRTLFAQGYDQFKKEIEGQTLTAALTSDIAIEYFPAEEAEYTPIIQWCKLSLPIRKGDLVANLNIESEGRILSSAPLYATIPLDEPLFTRLKKSPLLKGLFLLLPIAAYFFFLRRKYVS